MSTQRQAPRSKSRSIASQPAAQQSSAQSMASPRTKSTNDRDRQQAALDNQGAQGRNIKFSLREDEDDDNATRH
jgi:hypothetical protein